MGVSVNQPGLQVILQVGVVVVIMLFGVTRAQFSLSPEIACPMENVTFTCTALGNAVEWSLPNGINVILTGVGENINKEFVEFNVYILAVTGFNATAITSTLTTVAENGVTLSCTGQNPVETVGSSTIQLANPPGQPVNIQLLVLESSTDEVAIVSLQWDPPADDGGRAIQFYMVSISPLAQFSESIITTTSATVTANYSVRYTVSIVTTNCAGNSSITEYVFTICPPALLSPDVSTGAAVGITLSLSSVFFTLLGILIGVLVMYVINRCTTRDCNCCKEPARKETIVEETELKISSQQ